MGRRQDLGPCLAGSRVFQGRAAAQEAVSTGPPHPRSCLEAEAGNKSLNGAGPSMGHPAERLHRWPHLHKIMKLQ